MICGIKNARQHPCVLEKSHDLSVDWMHRQHKTADGQTFTFAREREKARPNRGYLMR